MPRLYLFEGGRYALTAFLRHETAGMEGAALGRICRAWHIARKQDFLGRFPLFSRFETTTAKLWENTFRLAFANLPLTMALAVVNGAALFCYVRWVVPLFFLPALAALISSLFIEPMLRPFMPEEEE